MPRTSERACALASIDDAIESATCAYLLASDEDMDDTDEEDIEDLLAMRESLAAYRYLAPCDITAGRHTADTLKDYIWEFPERTFLAFFHMHRASFWQLVDVLTKAEGDEYWGIKHGHAPKPAYQQIAIALYMLGGGAGTKERSRVHMNIGYGTL